MTRSTVTRKPSGSRNPWLDVTSGNRSLLKTQDGVFVDAAAESLGRVIRLGGAERPYNRLARRHQHRSRVIDLVHCVQRIVVNTIVITEVHRDNKRHAPNIAQD